MQRWNTLKRFATNVVEIQQTRGRVATVASVVTTKDVGSYWIGWMQKVRRKAGTTWGISQQHVGLLHLSKPLSNGKKIKSGCNIMA